MGDVAVTAAEEVPRRLTRRLDVVDVDEVGLEPVDPLEEDEGDVEPLELEEVGEVGVVVEDRRDDEAGDVLGRELLDDLLFALGVPLGAGDLDEEPGGLRDGLDAREGFRVVRVLGLLDDEPEARVPVVPVEPGAALGR